MEMKDYFTIGVSIAALAVSCCAFGVSWLSYRLAKARDQREQDAALPRVHWTLERTAPRKIAGTVEIENKLAHPIKAWHLRPFEPEGAGIFMGHYVETGTDPEQGYLVDPPNFGEEIQNGMIPAGETKKIKFLIVIGDRFGAPQPTRVRVVLALDEHSDPERPRTVEYVRAV